MSPTKEEIELRRKIAETGVMFEPSDVSECLDWFKERYENVSLGSVNNQWEIQLYDAYDRVHHPEFLEDIFGKTPFEACLKAMLAIVEYKQ